MFVFISRSSGEYVVGYAWDMLGSHHVANYERKVIFL